MALGKDDSPFVSFGQLTENFDIAADEQLIGCELNLNEPRDRLPLLIGVTWLKMKVQFDGKDENRVSKSD